MPVFSVNLPANLIIYLDALRKICEFDVISFKDIKAFFITPTSVEKTDEDLEDEKFTEGGFTSTNFL